MRVALALIRSSTPAWWPQRACAGVPTDVFYPEDEDDEEQVGPAKTICSGCPVAVECLEHGMASREPGVWGGRTERERENLRRRRHRVPAVPEGQQVLIEVSATR